MLSFFIFIAFAFFAPAAPPATLPPSLKHGIRNAKLKNPGESSIPMEYYNALKKYIPTETLWNENRNIFENAITKAQGMTVEQMMNDKQFWPEHPDATIVDFINKLKENEIVDKKELFKLNPTATAALKEHVKAVRAHDIEILEAAALDNFALVKTANLKVLRNKMLIKQLEQDHPALWEQLKDKIENKPIGELDTEFGKILNSNKAIVPLFRESERHVLEHQAELGQFEVLSRSLATIRKGSLLDKYLNERQSAFTDYRIPKGIPATESSRLQYSLGALTKKDQEITRLVNHADATIAAQAEKYLETRNELASELNKVIKETTKSFKALKTNLFGKMYYGVGMHLKPVRYAAYATLGLGLAAAGAYALGVFGNDHKAANGTTVSTK